MRTTAPPTATCGETAGHLISFSTAPSRLQASAPDVGCCPIGSWSLAKLFLKGAVRETDNPARRSCDYPTSQMGTKGRVHTTEAAGAAARAPSYTRREHAAQRRTSGQSNRWLGQRMGPVTQHSPPASPRVTRWLVSSVVRGTQQPSVSCLPVTRAVPGSTENQTKHGILLFHRICNKRNFNSLTAS